MTERFSDVLQPSATPYHSPKGDEIPMILLTLHDVLHRSPGLEVILIFSPLFFVQCPMFLLQTFNWAAVGCICSARSP